MALPTLLSNQPQAGFISWTAFGIQYDGVPYDVPAGNTNKKFVFWDYDAGTQVLPTRTNLAPNPGVASTTGFAATAMAMSVISSGGPIFNTGYLRATFNAARTITTGQDIIYLGAQPAWGGQTAGATAPVAPSTQYTISAWVRSSVSQSVRIQAQPINGAGGGTAVTINGGGGFVTLAANTWTRLWVTFTTPASGAPAIRIDLDAGASSVVYAQNDTLDIAMVHFELGTLRDPFHGSLANTWMDTTAWMGTPHASPSTMVSRAGLRNLMRDPGAANSSMVADGAPNVWAGAGGAVTSARAVDAPWANSGKALRATWTTAGTSGTLQIGNLRNVLLSNTTYTGMLEYKVISGTPSNLPNTASLTEVGVGNTTVIGSGRTDMGNGVYRAWVTFNVTDNTTLSVYGNPRLDFSVGNVPAGTVIEFSDLAIFEGTYDAATRNWFWGSSGALGDGYVGAWAGNPNNSVSVRTQLAPGLVYADVLPELAPEDMLLFLNKNGVGVLVPTTQVIEGSLIVSGSVLADAIGANQIDTWHLKAEAIKANVIAANAITAPAISAGAITTDKLTVASISDSLVANGSFEDGTQGWTVIQAGTGWTADVVQGNSSSGLKSLRMIRGNDVGEDFDLMVAQDTPFFVPVTAAGNKRWYVGARAGSPVDLPAGFYLRVLWLKENFQPSDISPISAIADNVALTTSWGTFEAQVAPPADAHFARIAAVNANAGSTMFVDEIVMYEITVAAMIGNGEIQTQHVRANAITADAIAANAVGADAIAANSIAANKIIAGAIQTNHLSPAVGAEIDISANRAVNLIAADVVAVRNGLGDLTGNVAVIATALTVTPTAVQITQANSDFKLSLTASSVSIIQGSDTRSTWTQKGLEVEAFIGKSVILGQHQITAGTNGTIVKAL